MADYARNNHLRLPSCQSERCLVGQDTIRRRRKAKRQRAGVRAAVADLEVHAREVVRDDSGGAGEIRHLEGQPGVHRLPQQLCAQTRLHTAHEPVRRPGKHLFTETENMKARWRYLS